MTARDWLMRQNPARRPNAHVPQASEGFARLVDAERASSSGRPVTPPNAGPVATAAAAAVDAAEAYYARIRAPWVPDVSTAAMLTAAQAKRLDAAFDRRPDCGVCSIRYSKCYCKEEAPDAS